MFAEESHAATEIEHRRRGLGIVSRDAPCKNGVADLLVEAPKVIPLAFPIGAVPVMGMARAAESQPMGSADQACRCTAGSAAATAAPPGDKAVAATGEGAGAVRVDCLRLSAGRSTKR